MSCGCSGNYAKNEAHTYSKKRKQRNFGPEVLVNIKGKTFRAHKKAGNPANFRKLHPKLQARARASAHVARQMKARGERVNITDKRFQAAVSRAVGSM